MDAIYEKYKALDIDGGLISLEQGEIMVPFFCYPVNAKVIGFEGCILYCFLPEYGEMVFASNPESCTEMNVYPLAKNFHDFMRLVLACGSANPVEQIVWMSRKKFEEHLRNEEEACAEEQKALLERLRSELGVSPMEDPYEYVKEVQREFDGSRVKYSDEYYDVTGRERE